MSDDRIIPTSQPADLPTMKIFTDGQEISGEYQVFSVVITRAVNKIPAAHITLLDGDVAKEDFKISNSEDFLPGKEIEIHAGYHGDEEMIFKGIVTAHALKSRKNKSSVLSVECKDRTVKMTVGRKSAYYTEMKDSDIIEEILGEYNLQAEVEATEVEHKELIKYACTDWDFMNARAEVNGRLVFVEDGKVSVKKPDTNQKPVLSLVHGATMLEFEAQMDARSQLSAVKCNAWDFSGQELLEEKNGSLSYTEQGNIDSNKLAETIGLDELSMQHTGRKSEAQLKAWADAVLLKSRLAKIIGRVRCQGFAGIKPGHMLGLQGVGERFNGVAFVTEVRHQISTKNWETDIQFGLPAAWFAQKNDFNDLPAAGLLAAVQGLQIGIVTQLGEDPDGEDRVLVRMPVISTGDDGVWARIASLDAGKNRGAFFRPEIGDEVVLGFLNADPTDAVILGMLNSSAKPAPITATDDNHEKGFITRSDMKLLFNDEEVSCKIATPNGNTIILSEGSGSILIEDENGNKIELNSSGITLKSDGDININAGGDINLEGTNINTKAEAQFKAEGTSGAEVSSAGTLVVKGSMVQIN
ncbi:type VI secretion system tip protein VgrG [candidate division KSB1 bacterium]|nr:type VI secretion system tip protein VgrG [candidate division KSB1 bacterium]